MDAVQLGRRVHQDYGVQLHLGWEWTIGGEWMEKGEGARRVDDCKNGGGREGKEGCLGWTAAGIADEV